MLEPQPLELVALLSLVDMVLYLAMLVGTVQQQLLVVRVAALPQRPCKHMFQVVVGAAVESMLVPQLDWAVLAAHRSPTSLMKQPLLVVRQVEQVVLLVPEPIQVLQWVGVVAAVAPEIREPLQRVAMVAVVVSTVEAVVVVQDQMEPLLRQEMVELVGLHFA